MIHNCRYRAIDIKKALNTGAHPKFLVSKYQRFLGLNQTIIRI